MRYEGKIQKNIRIYCKSEIAALFLACMVHYQRVVIPHVRYRNLFGNPLDGSGCRSVPCLSVAARISGEDCYLCNRDCIASVDFSQRSKNTCRFERFAGQSEKRNPADFALWKKAQPEHIMRWPSPWSDGFPGWHAECTAMGRKYLGEHFDIHGGGMDLIFPHHECEIAQSVASQGDDMVHYWMHNNMITINGTKMGKSLGNFITLDEFFTGTHKLLAQAYTPMTIRFFILQAHYRSTVDFSNEALQASEKGLQRLMEAIDALDKITPSSVTSEGINVKELRAKCYEAMNDDLNTPIVIAQLFEGARIINNIIAGNATISAEDLKDLKETFHLFSFDIMGLKEEKGSSDGREAAYGKVVDMLLEQRMKAKANKDWATSDEIRNTLTALGFEIKDTKDGFEWRLNK